MANGLLGKAALAADTNEVVYTVPADTTATVNINVVNRGNENAKVRVSIGTAEPPENEDFIEYDATVLSAGGVLERTAMACSAGEKVIVRDDQGSCSVRIHGFEESA